MEAVENCENCRKPFPQSKINSHFAYCRRNIRKCQLCSEMIDINHIEQHMQDEHTSEVCEHCTAHINAKDIEQHRRNCINKPVICAYCQQSVPVQNFDEHQDECGSRTKLCEKCSKSVLLREYDVHEATCEGMPSPATERAYTNYNDYLKRQREQLGMAPQAIIHPPKPIERIRVTAKDMESKNGESSTLKHSIKELGTRVTEIKAPRLHGTNEIGYFGDDNVQGNYFAPHPSGGRVISTTVTTRIDGKLVSSNTYPASTYQGGQNYQALPSYQTVAPTKTSVHAVHSAPYTSAGFQEQDAELQRALMQSMGYM